MLWCKIAKACFINNPAGICYALQVIDCKSADYLDCMLTINLSVVRKNVPVF